MASVGHVKLIKPSTLKVDAIRLALLNGIRKQATEIKKEFEKTTATWKTDVEFEEIVGMKGPGPELLVFTDNEIYGYVNNGTEPHPIPIRKPGPLHFQWGGKGSYTPKTTPRVIGSKSGGPSGPMVTFARIIEHPGNKARHFDEEIEKKTRPRFKRAMEKAMSDARKKSGHAI